MRKVYSLDDRIDLKVGDLKVTFRPLSYEEKSNIQALMVSGNIKSAMDGAYEALKTALVDIKGLCNRDGSAYLYDKEKFDDILNLPESPVLTKAALNLLSSVPSEFIDPSTSKALEGIEILEDTEEETGKK